MRRFLLAPALVAVAMLFSACDSTADFDSPSTTARAEPGGGGGSGDGGLSETITASASAGSSDLSDYSDVQLNNRHAFSANPAIGVGNLFYKSWIKNKCTSAEYTLYAYSVYLSNSYGRSIYADQSTPGVPGFPVDPVDFYDSSQVGSYCTSGYDVYSYTAVRNGGFVLEYDQDIQTYDPF